MSSKIPSRRAFLAALEPTKVADLPNSTAEDLSCHICFGKLSDEPQQDEERPVLLHGVHHFGETCIRNWLAENDNCPFCRQKLFKCDRYAKLIARLDAMNQLMRAAQSPINDREVLKLLERVQAACLTAPMATSQTIDEKGMRLIDARYRLYLKNPNLFVSSDYYAVAATQQPMALNQNALVDAAGQKESGLLAFQTQVWQGVGDSAQGRPVHVATHPLAGHVLQIIQLVLNIFDGRRINAYKLTQMLVKAINRDETLHHLVHVRRVQLPDAFRTLCDSMVAETVATAVAQDKASAVVH